MNYGATVSYENEFGTVTFSKESPFWLTATPNFSSVEVALDEMQSLGQIGTSIVSQSIGGRSITFTGTIVNEVESNRAKLLKVVSPELPAKITYTWGGKSCYIEGVPLRTPEINSGIVAQDFQFVFYAPFPYWKDSETLNIDINTAPLGLSSTTTVTNEGNVPAEFSLELYAWEAAVASPRFLLMESGRHIQVGTVMNIGERILISTEHGKKGARFNPAAGGSTVNGFKYLTLGSDLSLTLQPGRNVVQFYASSNRQGMKATLTVPRGVYSGV